VEDKIKLQRIRMLSALGDFQLALSAADFLQEAEENELYSKVELRRFRCYEHTAIVSYGRPFSQSKGKVPKLSLKQCGVKLTDKEKQFHDRIITLRNKLVAHTDLEMMNFASRTHDLSDAVGKPFNVVFTQHDEGLQLHNFHDQEMFIDLIRRVSFSLYQRLVEIAQGDPSAFDLTVHFPSS
jgi:hypothetical protein